RSTTAVAQLARLGAQRATAIGRRPGARSPIGPTGERHHGTGIRGRCAVSTASLPMYDFPEVRGATDAWWAGLARHLEHAGVTEVPAALLRRDDLIENGATPSC